MRKSSVIGLLSTIIIYNALNVQVHADTVYCTNCASEIKETIRQVQNFAQYAQQTSNMVARLELLRAQAARLNSDAPFSQTASLLGNVMSVMNQGQALGSDLGRLSQEFETQYPAFGKMHGSFSESYQKWSASVSDSIKNALQSTGYQAQNFENEAATAESLRRMNNSAVGSMQALQIGNAVSSEMLDEMRKLRQLNMAQMQAQNSYLLKQQGSEDSDVDGLKSFLNQKNSILESDEVLRQRMRGK